MYVNLELVIYLCLNTIGSQEQLKPIILGSLGKLTWAFLLFTFSGLFKGLH